MRLNGIERASVEKHVEIQPRLHTCRHPHSYLCIPLTVQDPTQQHRERWRQRLVIPPGHTSQTSHPAGGAGGGHTDRDAVPLGDSACDKRPQDLSPSKGSPPDVHRSQRYGTSFPRRRRASPSGQPAARLGSQMRLHDSASGVNFKGSGSFTLGS